ncbi:hypothetical protein OJ997_00205 [Solirubrobacter phytolaccae]|uniref:Uncharacterized protein n=1 Tax=Solirubrobacter phytolaccae TaxID=1404360 RepID=A0A9X3S5A9_9ACTN|nr:hypothetical protein [Solirubrobacter phytolaccae]MDA0178699.1 hypothetical protein [Solirubrobacter phytolaccae]
MTLTVGTLFGAPAHASPPGGGKGAPAADTRVPPSPHTDPALRTHASARPGSRERRHASRTAYTDLTRGEAVALAQRHFPGLDERGYRALDLEPGERVEAWLGARAARIARPGEADLLLESQLPLRTLGADGTPAPVDLSLRAGGDGFAPLAPIVALEVGDRAHEGITLDDIDVAVQPVGVSDSAGLTRQDKAFFTDTAPDTDHIVTPLPTGVDLGAQLRSPQSPERFRWRLELPAGARLQRSADAPGAEIVAADGAKLAHITAPVAWDADDQKVPSTLTVAGNELVVDVAHRGADVRYPVMLDPTILEDSSNWYANAAVPVDLSGWMWTDPGKRFSYFYGAAYLGNGLYTYNRGSTVFNAGDYANWYFNAPGTSRIVRADFGSVKHEPQTTGTYAAPSNDDRSYQGVWSYTLGRYENGTWCDVGQSAGTCGTSPFSTYGALHYTTKSHTGLEATPGNAAIFGTSVYYGGTHTAFTNFLGSATVWIEDVGPPTVTEDSGLSDQRWTSYRAFQARGTDSGLGLRKLVLDSPGTPGWSGAYTYDAGCTGDRRNRCPQAGYVFSDTNGLPEGVVPIRYTATDAVGNEFSRTWNLRIDRSGPSLSPDDGHLPGATGEGEDEDGWRTFTAHANDAGSGVRSIDFELEAEWGTIVDGSTDPDPQPCSASCDKARDWTVETRYLAPGVYTLRTIATDQLGNEAVSERTVEIAFGIPPVFR